MFKSGLKILRGFLRRRFVRNLTILCQKSRFQGSNDTFYIYTEKYCIIKFLHDDIGVYKCSII